MTEQANITPPKKTVPARGRVDFVGAGPGDPELLTVKALKALEAADVVIHDRLISDAILSLVGDDALLLNAGKEGFGPSMVQVDINRLILNHAVTGAHVVRLKSGDPTVLEGSAPGNLTVLLEAGSEEAVDRRNK